MCLPLHHETVPLQFRYVKAYAFFGFGACWVVVGKFIFLTAIGIVAVGVALPNNPLPHFKQLRFCCLFRFVVASLLGEAVNNARVLAVIRFVYCVIHCRIGYLVR